VDSSSRIAVIAEFAVWVDTDMLLPVALLICSTAIGCWYDIKSATESKNKWSGFMDGNNAIVNVLISVMVFVLLWELAYMTDSWFHLGLVLSPHFYGGTGRRPLSLYCRNLCHSTQAKASSGSWFLHNGFKRPMAGPRSKSVPHGTLCTRRLHSRLDSTYKHKFSILQKTKQKCVIVLLDCIVQPRLA
jgi:hypothetical protein